MGIDQANHSSLLDANLAIYFLAKYFFEEWLWVMKRLIGLMLELLCMILCVTRCFDTWLAGEIIVFERAEWRKSRE